MLCLWIGWRRLGTWLVSLATLILLIVTLLPLERLYLTPLERRFPIPELPATVDGIIVLGGGISSASSTARCVRRSTSSAATAWLPSRHWPGAIPMRLVFSGGSGSLRHPELREADAAGAILADFGLDPARLILQRRSVTPGRTPTSPRSR